MMKRSILSFTQPQRGCNSDIKEETTLFFSSLIDGLKRLDDSLGKEPVSLKWSIEALSLLKKMQNDLLVLFKKFNMPISFGSREDWFDQYMQETAILLDFCNTLKAAGSRFNQYCMFLNLSVQMFVGGHALRIADFDNLEFEKLEKPCERLLDVKLVKETLRVNPLGQTVPLRNRNYDKDMMLVMLASKTTMIVLCLILTSSLISPVSIDKGAYELNRIHEIKPCLDLLSCVTTKVRENFEKREIRIVEHQMVGQVLRDLKGQLIGGVAKDKKRFLKDLERLKEKSDELKEGVERFDLLLDKVFDDVIKGRNEMLGVFRDKTSLS